MPRDWSTDADYRAAFNREADLASTLWHPNVVGVHDRGEDDGQLWISMDYVDGLDASHLVAERHPTGMPAEEVAQILIAVARALDSAPKRGLLHRDVKPANIMITHLDEDGEQRILLTDFGLARDVTLFGDETTLSAAFAVEVGGTRVPWPPLGMGVPWLPAGRGAPGCEVPSALAGKPGSVTGAVVGVAGVAGAAVAAGDDV